MSGKLKIHKIEAAKFHRNGVCGEGFFAIDFTFRDGRALKKARAILFPPSDDKPDEFPARSAVTTADLSDMWRGADDFAVDLWRAMRDETIPGIYGGAS